jgi:hypothetical protein
MLERSPSGAAGSAIGAVALSPGCDCRRAPPVDPQRTPDEPQVGGHQAGSSSTTSPGTSRRRTAAAPPRRTRSRCEGPQRRDRRRRDISIADIAFAPDHDGDRVLRLSIRLATIAAAISTTIMKSVNWSASIAPRRDGVPDDRVRAWSFARGVVDAEADASDAAKRENRRPSARATGDGAAAGCVGLPQRASRVMPAAIPASTQLERLGRVLRRAFEPE